MEEFLLIALAVIYSVITYGHSPRESSSEWYRDRNQSQRNS
jgi:hypothetical protein